MVPIGFQLLAVLGGKALLLSKMALMLASINGLKRVSAVMYTAHVHGLYAYITNEYKTWSSNLIIFASLSCCVKHLRFYTFSCVAFFVCFGCRWRQAEPTTVYTILIHITITAFGSEVKIITFIRVHEAIRTEVPTLVSLSAQSTPEQHRCLFTATAHTLMMTYYCACLWLFHFRRQVLFRLKAEQILFISV